MVRTRSQLLSISLITFGLAIAPSAIAQTNPALNFPPAPLPPRSPAPLSFTPPTIAQATPTQGNQVTLNGQSFPVAWLQWQANGQPRIGLTDAALSQLFGIDLLSTSNVQQQPIQWFSASSTLSTFLTPPIRFLDITDLARQNGWQVQASGSVLQITTQPARVSGVRQGEQNFGDRIVIDLDRPAPWQIDPQSQEFILTVDAQINPAQIQTFKPNPASRIRSLKIEAQQNQTVIRIGLPIRFRPRITTEANPSRIVIDVGADFLSDRNIQWANGLRWRQQYISSGNAQFPTVWLEINPRQPGLTIRPILPNVTSMAGIAPLIETARRSQSTAAINGGYFNRITQLPLGIVRLENRLLSGPILNRGVVGWDDNGNWRFDRLTLQETATIASGQRFPLTTLNSGYIQAGIARYTSDWGSIYTTLSDNEILITIQNGQVATQQTVDKAGTTFPMPTSGYLLVFRSNRTAANSFPIGTAVQLESTFTPEAFNTFPNILGAGPLLLQNGQLVLDAKSERFSDAFIRERAARSAIGQTTDGRILIVAVQNNTTGLGATLSDIAEIMRQLGATNAVNLDGGSSTTLYLGGQILDRAPRSSARVHNGIGIFLQP